MRIGIIGGSFNPIHNGHLSIANLALDYLNLDKVIFIPTQNHPHKKESLTVSSLKRLAMTNLAITENCKFETSTIEIDMKTTSYTVETVKKILKENSSYKIFLIIGADNLETFSSWHKYQDILNLVTLVVTERPNYSISIPKELDSSKIVVFPSPHWGVSSSTIRDYLAKGLSCNYLVPHKVLEYIKDNSIYNGDINE
jgi:nicotinate-nucleotide adenylyltransferase